MASQSCVHFGLGGEAVASCRAHETSHNKHIPRAPPRSLWDTSTRRLRMCPGLASCLAEAFLIALPRSWPVESGVEVSAENCSRLTRSESLSIAPRRNENQ